MDEALRNFFSGLANKTDPSRITGINAAFQFVAAGDNGGTCNLKIVRGKAEVGDGNAANPDLTLTASVEDWAAIVSGTLDPQAAFLTGKLKLEGDVSLALKLRDILGV